MSRLGRLANEFLRKMENHATVEAARMRKPFRNGLIAITIGIVVVSLLALWMWHH